MTLSFISDISNHLPCLGIRCHSNRSASRRSSAAESDAGLWVLKFSCTTTTLLAAGKCLCDKALITSHSPERCGGR
jgi:hypothetical protein